MNSVAYAFVKFVYVGLAIVYHVDSLYLLFDHKSNRKHFLSSAFVRLRPKNKWQMPFTNHRLMLDYVHRV